MAVNTGVARFAPHTIIALGLLALILGAMALSGAPVAGHSGHLQGPKIGHLSQFAAPYAPAYASCSALVKARANVKPGGTSALRLSALIAARCGGEVAGTPVGAGTGPGIGNS